jgi:uncharacterized protein (DUF433 family)
MSLPDTLDPPPLRTDEHGVVRVGGTRVTLDTVIGAFRDGAAAEEIAFRYPALDLADIYAAITYYLRYRDEVDAYLAVRREQVAEARRQAEAFFDTSALREKLLARRRAGS